MKIFKTHGTFSFSDFFTRDINCLKDFFEKILDLKIEEVHTKYSNISMLIQNTIPYASYLDISSEPKTTKDSYTPYFTTNNMEETIKKVKELNCEIIYETSDEYFGKTAMIKLPEGSSFSIIEYSTFKEFNRPTDFLNLHGAIAWVDFETPDLKIFGKILTSIFGLSIRKFNLDFNDNYHTAHLNDENQTPVCGFYLSKENKSVPYFAVNNIESSLQLAIKHNATPISQISSHTTAKIVKLYLSNGIKVALLEHKNN